MSSTVGYGIQIIIIEGPEGLYGDIEALIEDNYSDMMLVQSRAEYGDQNKTFIFLRSTVVQAGISDGEESAVLNFHTPDASLFEAVFSDTDPYKPVGELGWYLVDYYEYS